MRISIALASYNGERFIAEQLASFLRQTRLPDEVVISDDGSTDRTLEIVEAFRKSAPFDVKVIRAEGNQGFVANFNRALEGTSGDLVFLSDQDDVWFANKLAMVEAKAHSEADAFVLMSDAALTDEHLMDVGVTKLAQIRGSGLPLTRFAMGCCAAIRREFLDLVMPIPGDFESHDVWLVKIADGIGRKCVIDDVLQYYRRHGNNISSGLTSALTPLTRFNYYKRHIERLVGGESEAGCSGSDQVRYISILREGVLRASGNARGDLADELKRFADRLDAMRGTLERRLYVRSRPRLLRIVEVMRLWRAGDYNAFSGGKSAVRDLMFK